MTNPVTSSSTDTTAAQAPETRSAAAVDGVTKDAFLRLLVAQLQHQDPLNRADGRQFLTQLAEFTQLEQAIGIRQELAAIRQALSAGAEQPQVKET